MTGTQCRNTGARRARRALLCGAILTTALATPSAASAADIVIAPDDGADQVTALDGTVVWISNGDGEETLWQKTADGVARVKGAPRDRYIRYISVDLGRNSKNKLVLTYKRCNEFSCKILTDDLKGHRKSLRHLAPKGCEVLTTAARWRSRSVYGLGCRDEGRSGLYVKTGSKAPKRLPRPAVARKLHITHVTEVDLRGTNVAAVLTANYEYAYVQTVQGKNMRSFRASSSGGVGDQRVPGLVVGLRGAMWALEQRKAPVVGGGNRERALIYRVTNTSVEREDLVDQLDSGQFVNPASDVAVDGSTVYLAVPGTGIVTHEFAPEHRWPL